MLIDLKDKVVVVTGAGRGIGRQIAQTFAAESAQVIALDLNQTDLSEVEAHLSRYDRPGRTALVDVRDLTAVDRVIAQIVADYGRIDVLINNAGVDRSGPVDDFDPAAWDTIFDVNVKGVFNLCRAVIPTMKRQHSGRILNAASFAAIVPAIGSAAYAASKSAVAQFSRALAGELGPWDITVNAYAPGMIPTDINGFLDRSAADQRRLLDTLTLRRWGEKSDVAQLLCFLACDLAGYITGALIDVSGGKLATQIPQVAYEWAAAEPD